MSAVPLEIEARGEEEVIVHVHSSPPPQNIVNLDSALEEALLDQGHTCSLARKNSDNKAANWRMLIALTLCIAFMFGEVAGGVIAKSLALLTDAAHLASDVISILVVLYTTHLSMRTAKSSHTFGYHRAEVLGSLISVLILLLVTGILVYEAVLRIISFSKGELEAVNGMLMTLIAIGGIIVNLFCLFVLGVHAGHSHDHGDEEGHDHDHDHHGHSHKEGGCSHNHPHDKPHDHRHDHPQEGGGGCTHDHDHSQHEGGKGCSHDHDHSQHEGGKGCSHDHDHSQHDQSHHEEHEGGKGCCHDHDHDRDHDHDEHEEHEGGCEGHHHDHSHQGHSHDDHDQEHGEGCNHDHHDPHPSRPRQACSHGHSHGIGVQSLIIHIIGDCVQSLGVVIAGIIIWVQPTWNIADPICTLLFGVLVCFTTFRIIRDIVDIIMERAPRNLDMATLVSQLKKIKGVARIHDLHVWAIKPGVVMLSVHINAKGGFTPHEVIVEASKVARDAGINHATIQCHPFEDACPCEPLLTKS